MVVANGCHDLVESETFFWGTKHSQPPKKAGKQTETLAILGTLFANENDYLFDMNNDTTPTLDVKNKKTPSNSQRPF